MKDFKKSEKMAKMKKDQEFRNMVQPLVEYLKKNHSPHTKIIIDCDRAEIVEGVQVENFTDENEDADKAEHTQETSSGRVVTPYTDTKGQKWVRVKAGDIDFLLDINDLSKKDLNWEDAMNLAKDNGMQLPDKRWWHLIAAFIDEINDTIVELGGDKLAGWYWSCSEYGGNYAWFFRSTYGTLYDGSKLSGSGVRGSLAFSNL